MKNNRSIKRRGFTLVELLIVIVVIGVLSAMMMLSSTEAVTSARASNIVSNLRNLKTAALAYYVDHMDDYPDTTTNSIEGKSADVFAYMNNSNKLDSYAGYNVQGEGVYTWFVKYEVTDANVGDKLKGRAKSVGLLKEAKQSGDVYQGGTGTVYMFVR